MDYRDITNWEDFEGGMVLALLEYCDGCNVLDPELLKVEMFPPKIVDRLSKFHKPNKDGIFAVLDEDNKKTKGKHGVYSLDLLYDIASDLNLGSALTKARNRMGQKEQAKILREAIQKYYEENS